MDDRGWFASDVERASAATGHPLRQVSTRTVYRVVKEGYVPSAPMQFEIAATFPTDGNAIGHLLPSHIWGGVTLPGEYAHLETVRTVAA